MTIVLNENEWAEEMIERHSLGKRPFETLSRVARYYLDQDYSRKTVRKMLEMFLVLCEPTASLPKWSETIDNALARAVKRKAVELDAIRITAPEMGTINGIEGNQLRRLAFTLLCLAKYWMAVNPKCDWWVNNSDSDIMKLANINTSIKRQEQMYRTLRESGLIEFSKKVDNTNVQVRFAEDGETVVEITDFQNLGYQYLFYMGDPHYMTCERCGCVDRKVHFDDPEYTYHPAGKQKYCVKCGYQNGARPSLRRTALSIT